MQTEGPTHPPEILIQQVWSGVQESTFLTNISGGSDMSDMQDHSETCQLNKQ